MDPQPWPCAKDRQLPAAMDCLHNPTCTAEHPLIILLKCSILKRVPKPEQNLCEYLGVALMKSDEKLDTGISSSRDNRLQGYRCDALMKIMNILILIIDRLLSRRNNLTWSQLRAFLRPGNLQIVALNCILIVELSLLDFGQMSGLKLRPRHSQ